MFRFTICLMLALASICGPTASLAKADSYIDISDYSYAAIAYSPSTGQYAYAYNYGSRKAAEQAALDRCKPDDARIVCWVNNGFCALALGNDVSCWGVGHRWGANASNTAAADRALEECRKRTAGAHLVLIISSDGQVIQEAK